MNFLEGNGYMDPDFRTSPIGFHYFLKKNELST